MSPCHGAARGRVRVNFLTVGQWTNFQCKYFTHLKYSSLPTLNGAHFYYTKFLGFSFYLHTNLNVGQLLSILSGTRSMQLLCGQCALLFTVCGTVQHFSNTDFSLTIIEILKTYPKLTLTSEVIIFLAHITLKNCNTIDTKIFGGLLLLFPCVLCIRCVIWDGQLQC